MSTEPQLKPTGYPEVSRLAQKPLNVLIIGGSGFIGRYLAAELTATKRVAQITIPTRRIARSSDLRVLPTVELRASDIHDDDQLAKLLTNQDVVINCVGLLHDPSTRSPYGQRFEQAHVTLVTRIARLAVAAGVPRLLHISALGANSEGSSAYLRSKGDGEAQLRHYSAQIALTVFQPSVVFGPGDSFTNLFATLARYTPAIMPVVQAHSKLQPVYVGDLAHAMLAAIADPQTINQSYQTAGPKAYPFIELVELILRLSGQKKYLWPMPNKLAYTFAKLAQRLPSPYVSVDNLDSMQTDNIADPNGSVPPNWQPRSLPSLADLWLSEQRSQCKKLHRWRSNYWQ